MADFALLVVLAFLAALSLWSLITGQRASSGQIAPPLAVRCRSAGGLLAMAVIAVVAVTGAAESVESYGLALLVAMVAGVALWTTGELIERRLDSGSVSPGDARPTTRVVADGERASARGDTIELQPPASRTIDLRGDVPVRTRRPERQPIDETTAIRLPRQR